MCDPLTAAGIAMSVAGTGLSTMEQNANVKRGVNAANAATAENFRQQDEYAAQARKRFNETLPETGADATRAGEKASTIYRTQAAEKALQPLADYAPTNPGDNNVVESETARKITDAINAGRGEGARRARLSSTGDAMFGNKLAVNDAAGDLSTISGFSRGTAALLPLQRSAAYQNAQKSPGLLGPGLQLIGGGLNMAGSFGLPDKLFGASPVGTSYFGGTGTNPLTGMRYGGV